jgi:hypothetical protein
MREIDWGHLSIINSEARRNGERSRRDIEFTYTAISIPETVIKTTIICIGDCHEL